MLLGPRSKLARIWPKIASHASYTFARDVLGEMLKRATCALCMVALHGSVPHRRCRVRLLLCRRCCVDLDALVLPHSLHSLPRSPSLFGTCTRRARPHSPWPPAKLAAATTPASSNFPWPNQQTHLIFLAAPRLPRSSPWPLATVSPPSPKLRLYAMHVRGRAALGHLWPS